MGNEFDDLDLSHLAVHGTTDFALSIIKIHSDKPLVLVMKPATADNPEYKSAHAKISKEAASARGDDGAMQALEIKLFALTVIIGWKNCHRPDGSEVPFSVDNCQKLLHRIDAVARDELRFAFAYARNADNFRASPEAAKATLGK